MAFNTPFSLGLWVRFEGTYALLVQNDVFFIAIVDGYVGMESTSLAGPLLSQTCLAIDEWYYISVTTDGSTVNLYVNGDLENQMPLTSSFLPGSTPLSIGNAIDQQDAFQIWNLVLYNAMRTADQEQVTPWIDVVPEPSLVANIDFSQAPAQELVANHPLIGSASSEQVTLAPCTSFDGLSGMVNIGIGNADIPSTPTYTISAWVNVSQLTPGLQCIFSSSTNPQQAITFYIDNQQPTFAIGGIVVWSPQPSAPLDVWTNYSFTMDANGALNVYINGDPMGEFAGFPNLPLTPPPWTLGATGGSVQDFFGGAVQWLSVWSRALSVIEVNQQLYDSVSDDPAIIVDAAFDAFPSKDLGSYGLPIDYVEGASHSDLSVPVTMWIAPPAQLNPAVMPIPSALRKKPTLWAQAPSATAISSSMPKIDDLVTDGLQTLNTYLAGVSGNVAKYYRDAFELKTREAYAYFASNPRAAKSCEWRVDGDDAVFFSLTGEVDRELIRYKSTDVTTCQSWWFSFFFTLIVGLFGLYLMKFDESALAQWISRNITNNPNYMGDLARVFDSEPVMSGAKVLIILGFLYSLGQVKRLLWTVAYMAGWWAIARFFAYLFACVFSGGVATAALIVKAAVLVAQLTLHYYGSPNDPGYQASCGSGFCKLEDGAIKPC